MADLLIHGQIRVRCGHVSKGACRVCITRDLVDPLDERIRLLEKASVSEDAAQQLAKADSQRCPACKGTKMTSFLGITGICSECRGSGRAA